MNPSLIPQPPNGYRRNSGKNVSAMYQNRFNTENEGKQKTWSPVPEMSKAHHSPLFTSDKKRYFEPKTPTKDKKSTIFSSTSLSNEYSEPGLSAKEMVRKGIDLPVGAGASSAVCTAASSTVSTAASFNVANGTSLNVPVENGTSLNASPNVPTRTASPVVPKKRNIVSRALENTNSIGKVMSELIQQDVRKSLEVEKGNRENKRVLLANSEMIEKLLKKVEMMEHQHKAELKCSYKRDLENEKRIKLLEDKLAETQVKTHDGLHREIGDNCMNGKRMNQTARNGDADIIQDASIFQGTINMLNDVNTQDTASKDQDKIGTEMVDDGRKKMHPKLDKSEFYQESDGALVFKKEDNVGPDVVEIKKNKSIPKTAYDDSGFSYVPGSSSIKDQQGPISNQFLISPEWFGEAKRDSLSPCHRPPQSQSVAVELASLAHSKDFVSPTYQSKSIPDTPFFDEVGPIESVHDRYYSTTPIRFGYDESVEDSPDHEIKKAANEDSVPLNAHDSDLNCTNASFSEDVFMPPVVKVDNVKDAEQNDAPIASLLPPPVEDQTNVAPPNKIDFSNETHTLPAEESSKDQPLHDLHDGGPPVGNSFPSYHQVHHPGQHGGNTMRHRRNVDPKTHVFNPNENKHEEITKEDTSKSKKTDEYIPSFEELLKDLYKAHNPENLKQIPQIVQKYTGDERGLIAGLKKKYGAMSVKELEKHLPELEKRAKVAPTKRSKQRRWSCFPSPCFLFILAMTAFMVLSANVFRQHCVRLQMDEAHKSILDSCNELSDTSVECDCVKSIGTEVKMALMDDPLKLVDATVGMARGTFMYFVAEPNAAFTEVGDTITVISTESYQKVKPYVNQTMEEAQSMWMSILKHASSIEIPSFDFEKNVETFNYHTMTALKVCQETWSIWYEKVAVHFNSPSEKDFPSKESDSLGDKNIDMQNAGENDFSSHSRHNKPEKDDSQKDMKDDIDPLPTNFEDEQNSPETGQVADEATSAPLSFVVPDDDKGMAEPVSLHELPKQIVDSPVQENIIADQPHHENIKVPENNVDTSNANEDTTSDVEEKLHDHTMDHTTIPEETSPGLNSMHTDVRDAKGLHDNVPEATDSTTNEAPATHMASDVNANAHDSEVDHNQNSEESQDTAASVESVVSNAEELELNKIENIPEVTEEVEDQVNAHTDSDFITSQSNDETKLHNVDETQTGEMPIQDALTHDVKAEEQSEKHQIDEKEIHNQVVENSTDEFEIDEEMNNPVLEMSFKESPHTEKAVHDKVINSPFEASQINEELIHDAVFDNQPEETVHDHAFENEPEDTQLNENVINGEVVENQPGELMHDLESETGHEEAQSDENVMNDVDIKKQTEEFQMDENVINDPKIEKQPDKSTFNEKEAEDALKEKILTETPIEKEDVHEALDDKQSELDEYSTNDSTSIPSIDESTSINQSTSIDQSTSVDESASIDENPPSHSTSEETLADSSKSSSIHATSNEPEFIDNIGQAEISPEKDSKSSHTPEHTSTDSQKHTSIFSNSKGKGSSHRTAVPPVHVLDGLRFGQQGYQQAAKQAKEALSNTRL